MIETRLRQTGQCWLHKMHRLWALKPCYIAYVTVMSHAAYVRVSTTRTWAHRVPYIGNCKQFAHARAIAPPFGLASDSAGRTHRLAVGSKLGRLCVTSRLTRKLAKAPSQNHSRKDAIEIAPSLKQSFNEISRIYKQTSANFYSNVFLQKCWITFL